MACILICSAQQIVGTIYPGSYRTKYAYHEGDYYGVSQSRLSNWYVTVVSC